MGRNDEEPNLEITSETINPTSNEVEKAKKNLGDKNNDINKKYDELADAVSKLNSNLNLNEKEKNKLADEVNDLQQSIDNLNEEVSILEDFVKTNEDTDNYVDTNSFFTRDDALINDYNKNIADGMDKTLAQENLDYLRSISTGKQGGMNENLNDIFVPIYFFNSMRDSKNDRLNFVKEELSNEKGKIHPNNTRLNALNDLLEKAQ